MTEDRFGLWDCGIIFVFDRDMLRTGSTTASVETPSGVGIVLKV